MEIPKIKLSEEEVAEAEELLQNIFLSLGETDTEMQDDIKQQMFYHLADFYDDDSYYPKPEDIFQDFLSCTPEEAHKIFKYFLHTATREAE